MSRISIGLLDSGIDRGTSIEVAAQMRFSLDEHGSVVTGPVTADGSGHGTELARIIAGLSRDAVLLDAQVFEGSAPGSAAAVAAGLDWVADNGAAVVNMSFGLRPDRLVLREACARARRRGILLVAAMPARGGPVYPAAYPGVVRVTGDARCAVGEYAWLGGEQVDFGACVGDLLHVPHAPGGGASYAVAHVTAYFATFLRAGGDAGDAIDDLRDRCRYRGPERRR